MRFFIFYVVLGASAVLLGWQFPAIQSSLILAFVFWLSPMVFGLINGSLEYFFLALFSPLLAGLCVIETHVWFSEDQNCYYDMIVWMVLINGLASLAITRLMRPAVRK